MSKRKNPLKDLDAFLKQETTSFVKPEQQKKEGLVTNAAEPEVSKETVMKAISILATKDNYRQDLYELIKFALEQLDNSKAGDKMLINTLLYLQDKENWQKNIRSYWKNQSFN